MAYPEPSQPSMVGSDCVSGRGGNHCDDDMTPREQLIEAMARASFNAEWGAEAWSNPSTTDFEREEARAIARINLTAIEAHGVALVPAEATDTMHDALLEVYTSDPVSAGERCRIFEAGVASSPYREPKP
jgi:hypothetical protein